MCIKLLHIVLSCDSSIMQGDFFQNIGSILVFAVFGTAISAMVVGGGIYLMGQVCCYAFPSLIIIVYYNYNLYISLNVCYLDVLHFVYFYLSHEFFIELIRNVRLLPWSPLQHNPKHSVGMFVITIMILIVKIVTHFI